MEVNLDTLLEEAAGGTPVQNEPVDNTDVVNNVTSTEDNVNDTHDIDSTDNTTTDNNVEQNKQAEQPKKSNPMKEVRDRLNLEQKLRTKIENAMQRYTDGDYKCKLRDYKTEDGKVDYDAFIKAMDAEDNEVKAKTNNRTPEVQAELDRIEAEKKEIQKERLKVSMDRELASIQVNLGLTNKDINNFFKDALDKKRNPYQWLSAGGSLEDLYYIIYRESIIEKRVNERTASTAPVNEAKPANPPLRNPGKPNATINTTDGITLDDLLIKAAKH